MADLRGVVEFSDRGISKLTGIPYQQVRTIHQKWLEDGTITNATANAPINAKHVFVTICDYDSYNAFNTFLNAVTNAVTNALNEDSRKEKVSSQTTTIELSKEIEELKKENNKLKEELTKKKGWESNSETETAVDFEKCWIAYNRKGSKKKSLEQWLRLNEEERKRVMPHIMFYVGSREKQYQKDFERYLRDKIFDEVIVKGNDVVYNPEKTNSANEYHPLTDRFQYWNEERQCLMFNGNIEQLNDGYADDDRPEGATVVWQMYEWVWSSRTKKWIKKNE